MIVRHYKGGMYEIITETIKVNEIPNNYFGHIEATHTETGEDVLVFRQVGGEFLTEDDSFVVYQSLKDTKIWARPRDMFWELGYFNDPDTLESRFTIIKE